MSAKTLKVASGILIIFFGFLYSPSWAVTQIGGSITTNTTLGPNGAQPDNVYWVTSHLIVESGVILTIEPGVALKFDGGTSLQLRNNSTLIAIGNPTQRIAFTSLRDDEFGGDTNGDGNGSMPQPGDWGKVWGSYGILTGIQIGALGVNVRMSDCVVRYSNTGMCVMVSDDPQHPHNDVQLEMTNCEFSYNRGFPVEVPVYSIPAVMNPTNSYHDNLWEAIGLCWGTLTNDLTIPKGKTYVLATLCYVEVLNATLTIEPGVVFKGMDRSVIIMRNYLSPGSAPFSKLIAIGTESEPIVFTSFLDDTYGGDTNGDGSATTPPAMPDITGFEWSGIVADHEAIEIDLEHCIIRYSEGSGVHAQSNINPTISLSNSTVEFCKQFPVVVPMNSVEEAVSESNT